MAYFTPPALVPSLEQSVDQDTQEYEEYDEDEDEDDDDDPDAEETKKPARKGLASKFKQIQKVGQSVQNRLGQFASYGEKLQK